MAHSHSDVEGYISSVPHLRFRLLPRVAWYAEGGVAGAGGGVVVVVVVAVVITVAVT